MLTFGYISFSVVIAWLLSLLDLMTGSGFVFALTDTKIFEIGITLFGFNLATHAILLGQVLNLEILAKDFTIFNNTRRQLRDNAVFNLILVLLILVSNTLKVTNYSVFYTNFPTKWVENYNYLLEIVTLACLILILLLVFETIRGAYSSVQKMRSVTK